MVAICRLWRLFLYFILAIHTLRVPAISPSPPRAPPELSFTCGSSSCANRVPCCLLCLLLRHVLPLSCLPPAEAPPAPIESESFMSPPRAPPELPFTYESSSCANRVPCCLLLITSPPCASLELPSTYGSLSCAIEYESSTRQPLLPLTNASV